MFRIFLEAKPVATIPNFGGHLYLVYRDVGEDNQNLYSPLTDVVIRGGPSNKGSALEIVRASLWGSEDDYHSGEGPGSRDSVDITGLLGMSAESAWAKLSAAAAALNNEYEYELPGASSSEVANSNAVIFTLLNSFGVDVPSISSA